MRTKYSFFWLQDGVMKDSSGKTAEEALEEFRERQIKPIYPYPVSSVELNMFLAHIKEAVDLADPNDKDAILDKAEKMVEIQPYTNWSGD